MKYFFFFIFFLNINLAFSQSLNLPINRSWINIGDLDVQGDKITVEALIYLDQPANMANNVVSKHTSPSNVNYLLRPKTFELTTYVSGNSGTTKFLQMINPYDLSLNKWYHIAGTYDGKSVKYYVDGCLVITTPWSGNLFQNDIITAIGNMSNINVNEQFIGNLDEVRIWNVCRSESEIASNMTSLPNPTSQAGLIAYYKFSNNYINNQGNAAWNGTPVGPLSFSLAEANIQPFAISTIQLSSSTCAKTKDGSITIKDNGTNTLYSIDGVNYQTSNVFTNLSPGTFTVYVKSAAGCILDSTITVGNNKFFFSINMSSTICQGETIFGHTVSGIYQDTLISTSGCDSIRTLNLTVKPKSSLIINKSICQGQSYLGYTKSGTYIDTFQAANGCDSLRTLMLTVEGFPKPILGADSELCIGDTLILSPGNFLTYLWQDNATSKQYIVSGAGLYSVTVTNACGSGTAQTLISERLCNEAFPNAFTPNNDGKNDVFKLLNAFNSKEFKLSIFNRWGNKVFETADYNKGWDGTFFGKHMDPGVFVYYCTYIKNGKKIQTKGAFTLLR